MKSAYYIGIMSGTSLDGIDVALADFSSSPPSLPHTFYLPYNEDLRNRLLALHQSGEDELHRAAMLGNELARCYAAAVASLLKQSGMEAQSVTAIGCHGQTVRHRPELGYTLQLNNPALLAELTGITVVADFRSRDIAAGGQGAPLVPAFHQALFGNPKIHRVIVNIGGIANLTSLAPDGANGKVVGFDCGPGNLLMDAWCMRHTGKAYDENGAWAGSGKVIPALLEKLLAHPFFSLPPPKSTGREAFNLTWLESCLVGGTNAADAADVQATLLQVTIEGIARSVIAHCSDAVEVYLCGGGARNGLLLARLRAALAGKKVDLSDALGVDADSLEAFAFAWLAQQTMLGQPGNLPAVTGAKHPCVLGAIYPG